VRTDVPRGKPPEVKFSDGNHRAAAAKAAGATEILAEVEVVGRGARGQEKVLHRYRGPVPLFDGAGRAGAAPRTASAAAASGNAVCSSRRMPRDAGLTTRRCSVLWAQAR